MPWQQLIFDSSRDAAPALEEALLESGALSVTLQDSADEPVLEPGVGERPLWSETRVVALFDVDADLDIALRGMSRLPVPRLMAAVVAARDAPSSQPKLPPCNSGSYPRRGRRCISSFCRNQIA